LKNLEVEVPFVLLKKLGKNVVILQGDLGKLFLV